MIGITFEVYQDTLIALRVFFFVKEHKKIRQKHKKIIKTLDKEFNEVYNIIINKNRGIKNE